MLKRTKFALLGVVAAAAMASTGAQAATQTATAQVNIVAAVTLAQNNALDLGIVATSGTAGTVVLPTGSDTRVCSTGVSCLGSALRGRFTVGGATSGYVVAINVPASTTLTSAGNNMVLTLTPSMTSFTSTTTPQTFFVGGSLAVGANQAAGTYTGSYNVSADYQ